MADRQRFRELTRIAAEHEQAESYRLASMAWLRAAEQSRKKENVEYCLKRSEICDRMPTIKRRKWRK